MSNKLGRTIFDCDPNPAEPTKFNFDLPDWVELSQPKSATEMNLKAFLQRYGTNESEVAIGLDVRKQWKILTNLIGSAEGEISAVNLPGITTVLDSLSRIQRSPISKTPVLFISYRSTDRGLANFLRHFAVSSSVNVWMDVYDPCLFAIKSSRLPSHLESLLIAIVIEIALLNCTHLAVVHTRHTSTSVWVPYELGRVKQRLISSCNAAFWYQGTRIPSYSFLVERFHRPTQWLDLKAWIKAI